jgi:methionine-R-sulfoxide reductase
MKDGEEATMKSLLWAVIITALGAAAPGFAAGRGEAPQAAGTAGPAMAAGPARTAAGGPAPVPPPGVAGEYRKPAEEQLRKTLTALQFDVTQREGTEMPFNNTYWNNHAEGIYVDVVSGEPLFSSRDKYESGTGWPSFTRPLEPGNVVTVTDSSLGMVRTEVRSRFAGSHLGHLFDDGPAPTGLRYCMNSAAMRFVPVSELKVRGYDRYLELFAK